ncbi:MAG: 16S rRNA (guanine(527)-N(7))-methyltransferase RsmG [Clostridia bacterium]|nr:16S rRNA (guanine(527)-N(7))-methyltransferase RsmG [Clostridia bacterium]
MKELFFRAGIVLDEVQEERFLRYADLLTEYNEKFNLTAITDRREIYEKHFLDSALGGAYLSAGAEVVDVGSGAGFPAIPLKILRPDLKITMLDSLQKRVGFLNVVLQELGLAGIEAVHGRAEDFAKTNRERYDYAVARAVAPLDVLSEYCLPFVKVGGAFIAYKGRNAEEELATATRAIEILGGRETEVHAYALPSGDERAILTIKKGAPTPRKYPRGQNKPRTNPLR